MLNFIITWSLRHRLMVIGATLAFVVVGFVSLQHLDVDAFPDTTPVQVQINTTAPALAPEEVETQITFPVEQAISGLPSLDIVRSVSKFGLSQVVVTFEDGTDIYFARQLISERLGTVELPEGISSPEMGPVSTGLGEVFHYIITSKDGDLTHARTVHDWTVKPSMRTVPGTAEINSWGGYEKQYQIRLDPARLIKHGLSFSEVVEAVTVNNLNVGGGYIERSGSMLLVHGLGRVINTDQLEKIVLTSEDGVPVTLAQVAEVTIGHEIRRGAVTANGKGEAVLGLGFMLMGENSHDVTQRLKDKLESVKETLPPEIEVETVYDRTELVDFVIETVRKNLFEGGLLVIAVLFMFLGNLRAGLIVALAIPMSMLFSFSGMLRYGISASLLSLGALDFGLVVDSSVIMVENVMRHMSLGKGKNKSRLDIVRDAAIEVRRPTMFGELIIMVVYLPILTLEGIEGKLFRPMALTVIFALLGSMVLSLTLVPVLASYFLPKKMKEHDPWIARLARRVYAPILRLAMRFRMATLGLAFGLLALAAMIFPSLGSEFVPRLSEGAVSINVVRLAGTDLGESIRYNTQIEKALLAAFPDEIRHVWSRIGTAEVATDPMGVELSDIFISLNPREEWTKANTQDELVSMMQKELRDMPGQRLAYTQPIEMRINEMVAGIRSDVAVKLFGDDFSELVSTASDIEAVLRSIDGVADLSTEQVTGQPILQVRVNQEEAARYGVSAKQILDLVESVGGKPLGDVIEGQLRFPLVVRLPEEHRENPEAIGNIRISTPSGEQIPLWRVASVVSTEGPSTITREWGRRRITVQCNVRDRDIGSFVAEAQKAIAEQITLPEGRYHIEWGGQFENLERARTRLMVVVPLALAFIFILLYMSVNSVRLALLISTGVPLAVTGGILALWFRGLPFSISAAVGFIALSGVAVLDGLVMVTFIRQLRRQGKPLKEAVFEGSMTRLRPVLMTTLVASFGFVPMALATGMGAEVQRPLATVVIGGAVSQLLLTLITLPILYGWFEPKGERLSSENLEVEFSGIEKGTT